MKRLSAIGYQLNRIFLCCNIFYLTILFFTGTLETAYYLFSNLYPYVCAIACLIWLLPNLRYFGKRKYLFYPYPPRPQSGGWNARS